MSQKRQSEDAKVGFEPSGPPDPEEKRQKVPALRRVILEAVKMDTIQKILSGMEPLLRKIVKEEVEMAFRKHLISMKQNCGKQVYPSVSRNLQLQFRNRLSLPVFTGAKIEGEDGSVIEIALVNALTGEVVRSGTLSLAKVEIVVLEGDFDEDDSWTLENFKNNIVKEREGKRPLLNGDTILELNEGTSVVGELVFTDNSSWTRSRKFRLGARVIDNKCDGIRVREARTDSFMVKDHRGELYKKHYPPSLADEVWRLEKIGKDGAFHKRLSRENIKNVKDFLTLFFVDAPRLRNILGTGMSAKMWEVTTDHARTCTLDDRKYLYYPPSAQQGTGVVFNVVGQALGILSQGQYTPVDSLSESEKVDAHKMVILAYGHWDEVISYETGINSSSHLPAGDFPSNFASVGTSYSGNVPCSHKLDEYHFTPPDASSSDMVSSMLTFGGTGSSDNLSFQGIDGMDLQPSSFPSQFSNSLKSDLEAISQSMISGDHLQCFGADPFLQSPNFCLESEDDLQTAINSFLAMSARSAADKAHTRWNTLFRVLRWRFSIKRIIASKKHGHAKWKHT